MPINQTETNLEAITVTIALLEKQENIDEEQLQKLVKENILAAIPIKSKYQFHSRYVEEFFKEQNNNPK